MDDMHSTFYMDDLSLTTEKITVWQDNKAKIILLLNQFRVTGQSKLECST